MEAASQIRQILLHLKQRGSITQLEAFQRYNCFRLGARIYDLRRSGVEITTTRETNAQNKNYARYRLIQK